MKFSKVYYFFSKIIFYLGIVYSAFISIFFIYRMFNNPFGYGDEFFIIYYFYFFISIVSIFLFFFGLKLKTDTRVNLSIVIFVIFTLIYSFESYFEFSSYKITKIVHNDSVHKNKFIRSKIHEGIDIAPNFIPNLWIPIDGLKNKNGKIFPLGGISNTKIVLDNESGFYPIIKNDRYGFNNLDSLYEENIKIVLIGDSFGTGVGVNYEDSIVGNLNKLNINSISFAKEGNSSLIEYATLKEYAINIKPRVVLWQYFLNDLEDLSFELQSPLLKKYITDESFFQNLISRQSEIDQVLNEYYQKHNIENFSFIKILKITNIRYKIRNLFQSRKDINTNPLEDFNYNNTEVININLEITEKILKSAKKIVSTWGGELYFLYLPSYHCYANSEYNEYVYKKDIINIVKKLNIPIIDVHEEVFIYHSDPLSLFPFRRHNHYNGEGNYLISDYIKKRLNNDNAF